MGDKLPDSPDVMSTYEDLGFAKAEPHRITRQGFPEAIFCQGKTFEQILKIFDVLYKGPGPVIATRVERNVGEALARAYPDAVHHPVPRLVVAKPKPVDSTQAVYVVTAGTSDLPFAEEAAITAETLGRKVNRLFDVGVAGMHRLLDKSEMLKKADVVIVCAGMEGALASVVGGLVSCPVIAVPTSVGYGVHLKGLAPLLAMMSSCAANVSVVNIDNGFSAGVIASLITKERTHGIDR
jgi:NCAIR mutase (PurE)-related protein